MCSPLGPALISFLEVILDPWPWPQEPLQRDEILSNLTKGENRYRSLTHQRDESLKGPRYEKSGQIFQLAVKSYLWFKKDAKGRK